MNSDQDQAKPIQHMDADGSIYAAELVPPEQDDAKYHVDLVRTSVDDYGLGREQRLTVGQYSSWMEAEEHLHDVEDGLAQNGLSALSEDAGRLREQSFEEDVFYLTAIYPPEAEGSDRAAAHLLAVDERNIATATLAAGEQDDVSAVAERVDVAFAEEGADAGLALAQQEAELNGAQLFNPDDGAVRHVDGGGTAHWFGVMEADEGYELHYFRALEMGDGTERTDSYTVMPLPDSDPDSAWPLRGFKMYLEKGDVYMAQQFAHDVADAYGQDFPEPHDLPALDPRPEYYFGYGVGESNRPSLEAVKTWMEGAERRFDTLTINEYDNYEEAAIDEYILDTALATDGVEHALNIAEGWAADNGYLDPTRDDPRIFFEDDAPADPFTTNRQREIPDYGFGAISAKGEHFIDVVKSWGDDEYELLTIPQPTWEDAQLAAEIAFTDQQNGDLQAAMRRIEALAEDAGVLDPERMDGRLFTQGPPDPFETQRQQDIRENPFLYGDVLPEVEGDLTDDFNPFLDRFDPMSPDEADPNILRPIDDTVNYGVQVMDVDPDTIELSVEKYWNEPNGFLGIQSVTVQTYDSQSEHGREPALADQAFLLEFHADNGLGAMMNRAENMAVANGHLDPDRDDPRLFTDGPLDRFETLAERLEGEINPYWNTEGESIPQPQAAENPYWRMETLPVNDFDGEPLGHALHMVVYPHVAHDPEYVGTPAMAEDEPFRMLEMAHFETTEAADKFGREFNGYLQPGLLEGPELAQEVARLEGLPVEWRTLEGDDLTAYQNLTLTLTRDPADWHPYNPHAERDARIEAEGLYTDPIQGVMKLDEDESKVESVSPDFDL